jgi:predicted dehydrogenase
MSNDHHYTRREFVGGAMTAGAAMTLRGTAARIADEQKKPDRSARKIKLGLIGCGGRGSWLGDLFTQHGGYRVHAVADYFPERAARAGDKFGVDKGRRFSGLSAYQRLLDSGVEAVTVVNVPRFHPDHGLAAIEAGCHVFAAKPVAIDVPGALKVQAAGQLAARKNLTYLVDYQMGTDPVNIDVVRRIHEGGLGSLMHVDSLGFSPPWGEPVIKTAEDRLRRWFATTALSGDVIVENTVHSINAVLWVTGKRPSRAIGRTRACRPDARTDFQEVYLVTYEFDDGLLWTHRCQALRNQLDWELKLDAYGDQATALVSYRGKSHVRGGPMHIGPRPVVSLYDQGAIRNIATFHQRIVKDQPGSATARQAGDDALTAVLGREACRRKMPLTMEGLIAENTRLEFDTTGLKS